VQLSIASYHENVSGHLGSDVVECKLLEDHPNHVPDDLKKSGMLPIKSTVLDTIKFRLALGNKCKSIRSVTLEMLDILKEKKKKTKDLDILFMMMFTI
jgi:hypothetical protein